MTDCRTSDRILLVEGEDDLHVVLHLCKRIAKRDAGQAASMPEFCIDAKGGVNKLLDALDGEMKVDGRQAVGIVVDADENPLERWKSVADRLLEVGIEIPGESRQDGICIERLRQEDAPRRRSHMAIV